MARDRDRTAAKPERKNCQLGGPVASKWDLTHGSGSTSVNGVDSHPPHANTRQVQTNRHNIRHRGLLGPANLVTHRFQRGLTPTVIATSPGFWDVSPGFWGSSPKFTDFANLNGIGQQLEVVIGSLEATTLHNVHYGTFRFIWWRPEVLPMSDLTLLGEFSQTWRTFSSSWRMSHTRGESGLRMSTAAREQPRCLPHATPNRVPRRLHRQGGPAAPLGRSLTERPSMSITPAAHLCQDPVR